MSAATSPGRPDGGEGPEHGVVDAAGHLLPPARLGQRVELGLEVTPPLDLEHRPVGGRRGVEGQEPPTGRPGRLQLLLGATAADDDLAGHGEVGPLRARRGPGPRRWPAGSAGRSARPVLNGITRRPSATSAARRTIWGPSPPRATGGMPEGVRARVEHRRHQGVGGELAPEVERLAGLPGGEDGPQRADQLPHAGDGPVEGGAVPLLHLGPDLGAETQGEPTPGQQLEVIGLVGQLDGIAGEGDGHVGGQLQSGGGPGGQDQRREHVVGALEGEGPVHPELLEAAGVVGGVLEPGELGVDLHRSMFPSRNGRPPHPAGRDGDRRRASDGDTLGHGTHASAHPRRPPPSSAPATAVGFGLGPANPDAFLTALGQRDDWEDLIFGGALLLGYYTVLLHPGVSYRCGFFGPAERMMLAQGANIELVPGGFRQFAPILRRFAPRVMTAQAAPPDATARSTSRSTSAPPTRSCCWPGGTPTGC